MKALFEVKSIVQLWKPPFSKTIVSKEYVVGEKDSFDTFERIKEPSFKLLKIGGDRVLIEFNNQYTLKGYENPALKQKWLTKQDELVVTFLWGEDGITKKLKFLGLTNKEIEALKQSDVESDGVVEVQKEELVSDVSQELGVEQSVESSQHTTIYRPASARK